MSELLFSPFQIGTLALPNRLVRSATHEGLASAEGRVTEALISTLTALADGGVGLMMTGHAFVAAAGRAGRNQLAVDSDDCVEGLAKLAAAVHAHGGKIALQLAHAGGAAADTANAAGPSAFAPAGFRGGNASCRALEEVDIVELIMAFGAAARRAREAGFDAVEIHAAHGYCLSQFLSPFYNRRSDRFGGSIENRSRLLFEVLASVRAAVGETFPVLAKINSEDFIDGGFSSDECVLVAEGLARRGLDAIEISGGIPEAGDKLSPVRTVDPDESDTPYFAATAARVRRAAGIPVALVGGIRYPGVAERLLESGVCDLVSLCRPLIREPRLPERWRSGDVRRADCITCNACFRPILTGRGFGCPIAAKG